MCLTDEELQDELRRMTDSFTDELFAMEPTVATAVVFPVSRLALDPERFLDDASEPMAARGMGVLYTHTSQRGVLRHPISPAERARLVAQWYHPHHEQLKRAVDSILTARGSCLVIDCHSFASEALPYELDQSKDRPEICLGTDDYHTPTALVEAAHEAFVAAGLTVALNRPFAGALVPAAHYHRDARVRALMIEVNRGLYMDEPSATRGPTFDAIRERLQAALLRLIAAADML